MSQETSNYGSTNNPASAPPGAIQGAGEMVGNTMVYQMLPPTERGDEETPSFAKVEGAEDRDSRDYNIGETYYLKNTGGNKKWLRGLVPLVVALLIVAGVGFYFLRDFKHLYPGPGGEEEEPNTKADVKYLPVDTTSDSTHSETKTSGGEEVHSSSLITCKANSKCAEDGLTGLCCPTKSGVVLACCD